MNTLHTVLASLLLATTATACATGDAPDAPEAESTELSELELFQRRMQCHLEYTRYSPDFHTSHAAAFDEPMSVVRNAGATASDGRFALETRINPNPPYNLSFVVSIRDLTTGKTIAYTVLPPPRLGGDYLFELGGRIEPITVPAGGDQQFDFMRSYCSLYLAE